MNNLDDEIYVKLEYSRQENQSRNFRLDVELHLPGKGITAVFGESGSGKTTLLRCIAGLEKSALGIVKMKSEVWQEGNLTDKSKACRIRISRAKFVSSSDGSRQYAIWCEAPWSNS